MHDDVAVSSTMGQLGSGITGVAASADARIRRLDTREPAAADPLPRALVDGVAQLSGLDISSTRIRRRSDAAPQIGARAFAYGTEIHLAPGHESRLPHEAWHVVQQRQGRAQPMATNVGGVGVSLDRSLEREADVMGARAVELGRFGAPAGAPSPGCVDVPVLQGDFLNWAWNTLSGAASYVAGAVGLAAPAQQQPADAQPLPAGPIPPPLAAPVLGDPAAMRQRIVSAETALTNAAATLPARLRQTWQQDEPACVEARLRPAFALLAHLVAFPDAAASANAEARTAEIERNAASYRNYCAELVPDLRQVCELEAAYRTDLTAASTAHVGAISQHLEGGIHTAAETRQVCNQFLTQARLDSARTSAGLQAMMVAGGPQKAQAERLVAAYFAHGRLKIGRWRVGYASGFDSKTGAFGAEWTLSSREAELQSIAANWVFHTHATCDPAGNFTVSRVQGASHIKPIALAHGAGTSLNFVDQREFAHAENDEDTKKSFASWVTRGGWAALRNQNKRQ